MKTTKIFKSNNSFAAKRSKKLTQAFQLLSQMPTDFFKKGREISLPQERCCINNFQEK